jgi:GTP-binding protein
VPLGTVVSDASRGNVLRDLSQPGESFVVVRGGRGGRGNARFKSGTNRVPRDWEVGQLGEDRLIQLSLKLIADVGLIGLPNAGKSTLVSVLSRARPKIADYPFTTLEPCLGIVAGRGDESFVMADIPGLIEGAHEGKGLGDKFLRHVERTRVLVHLVDCATGAEDPAHAYRVVRREIAGYSTAMAARPTVVVATKVEDEESATRARDFGAEIGVPVIAISAAKRQGLAPLVDAVLPFVRAERN